MTVSLVTGLDSMQNLVTNAQMNVKSDTTTSFASFLDGSTGKSETPDVKEPAVQQADSRQADDSNVAEANKAADKAPVDDQTAKADPKDASKMEDGPREEPEELSDEEVEEVASVAAQMISTIADVLNVTVEDVENTLEDMGIQDLEVLNPAVIPDVAVELTDATDVMEIMTDEDLGTDVKELMTEAEDLMDQLSQELEIPVEDLKKQIQNTVEQVKADEEPMVVDEDGKPILTAMDETEVLTGPEVSETSNKSNLKQNTGENHESNENHDAGSQFAQTVTDTIKEAVVDKLMETPVSYSTVDADQIMEQVTESLKLHNNEDMTEMEMQLHPASLGNVKVQVASKDGVITANFTTQNETVKAALESQIVQLKEQMNEQGIKVAAVEVTVSSHAFERNLDEQGGGQPGEDAEPKKRGRRSINLGGLEDMTDEPLDDGDQVIADMMARNGNSVDYLA